MNVKLSLPATFADLSLRDLQVLETSEDPMTCVGAVTGIDWDELREMPRALIQEGFNHLQALRKAETQRHLETFELHGTRYGFVPNWDEFTAGEWIDAEQLCEDFWKNAHKVMALLFRPVTRSVGDRYMIEAYTAKEDPTPFLDMPADQVAGALLFFDYQKRTSDHFGVLFDSGGDEGGDDFGEKWGWYPVLYSLAGEDILRVEAVTKLTVGHVFTHLAFLKDLEFKRKQATA